MIEKILLLSNLAYIASCGTNNVPTFDQTKKTFDCTDGMDVTMPCNIMLVIDPLTSMTYYNIKEDERELRGYRARFDSNGNLVTLLPSSQLPLNFSSFPPPVQTDGHFRPIITINGQVPGPTIIAHENQRLVISVYNELKNVEGVTIHWHGMHHKDTQRADGVAFITQRPIPPNTQFTYDFYASPGGTHWYHAHSGAQRTDGIYGALIVKDTLPGNMYDFDYPDQHTLLLMDWQRDASIDLFYEKGFDLVYWKEVPAAGQEGYVPYSVTRSADGTVVGPLPFWSGIINNKGRHYDEMNQTNIRNNDLCYFNVSEGDRYRFRLIGAQALFAFRFSIQDHKMTVVSTDGSPIVPIEDVDYVIVNTGERYDVIVHANQTSGNYWIWAETLEVETNISQGFYNSISKHRAEAILHYEGSDDANINDVDEIKTCTSSSPCKAINCPIRYYGDIIQCTNADEFESVPDHVIPQSIYSPDDTVFLNFGFDGESTTFGGSADGVNFRFPANPPLTEYAEFQNSSDMCPTRGCDHDDATHCACTQVIDISSQPRGSVVELVMTNRVTDGSTPNGAAHPMHLHGHYFYVVKIGYSEKDTSGLFSAANDDVECVITATNASCPRNFIAVENQNGGFKQSLRWRDMIRPPGIDTQNRFARKDTVIVPFGGYTVIRFVVDNPGWWFLHCHIEVHQLEGMAVVIKELPNEIPTNNVVACPGAGGSLSNLRVSPLIMMVGVIITTLCVYLA